MNIVSMIMKMITPELIMKIATAVGLDKMVIQKALGAAIPSVLAGLAGAASKPDGARGLADMLGKLDPGLLGSLAGAIGGADQPKLVESGGSMLSGILGGPATAALGGAVAKFAGIGDGEAKTLLGLAAPAVLGTLGNHARESSLDAGGLASLLASQKDNISAAMPAGFASMLGGTGLLDSLAGATSAASGAAARAASAASSAATSMAGAATRAASSAEATVRSGGSAGMGIMPWIIGLVILGGLAYVFLGDRMRSSGTPGAASKIVFNNVDVGGQLNTAIDGFKSSLAAIKDEPSARASVPRLQSAVKGIEVVSEIATKMGAPEKKSLGGLATTIITALRPLIDAALKNAGPAAGVIKPVIDSVLARLEALTKL